MSEGRVRRSNAGTNPLYAYVLFTRAPLLPPVSPRKRLRYHPRFAWFHRDGFSQDRMREIASKLAQDIIDGHYSGPKVAANCKLAMDSDVPYHLIKHQYGKLLAAQGKRPRTAEAREELAQVTADMMAMAAEESEESGGGAADSESGGGKKSKVMHVYVYTHRGPGGELLPGSQELQDAAMHERSLTRAELERQRTKWSVEKELLEGRVRSFQAEVDVLKTEHKSLTTSNKSLATKNKELEKKHTTAVERVKSLEQAAKVKGDAHKKEIEVLTAKWRGVVAGNKALSKSETDLENMIAKMRKELAAVEQKAKDAEAKAFAKVKAQVENLRRLKNEAQARARVAEEAREALAGVTMSGVNDDGETTYQCLRLEYEAMKTKFDAMKENDRLWRNRRTMELVSNGTVGNLKAPREYRPYALAIVATGASDAQICAIIRLTLEYEHGYELGSSMKVLSETYYSDLRKFQLPTFAQTMAALQIGAADRGLCINWDEGTIQKKHGSTITIVVEIQNPDDPTLTHAVPLVTIKDIAGGSAEDLADSVHLHLKRAERLAERARDKIRASGLDPDELAPIRMEGHGTELGWLDGMYGEKTDNANAALASQDRLAEKRGRRMFRGRCTAHLFDLIPKWFVKLLDKFLEEEIGRESREASSPSCRVEVGFKQLLLSACKNLRTHGFNHNGKADTEFLRALEDMGDITLLDLGRGECGSRFNFICE